MYVHLEELFKYRQYVDCPVNYCFDRKLYQICDAASAEQKCDTFYDRYIPMFQIDTETLERDFIASCNDRFLLRAFKDSSCCFEEFVQRAGLFHRWWNFYRLEVAKAAIAWCDKYHIKYTGSGMIFRDDGTLV